MKKDLSDLYFNLSKKQNSFSDHQKLERKLKSVTKSATSSI